MHTKTILIIDKEKAVRESLFFVLTKEGYNCFTSNEEADAKKILSEKEIGIITLDSQFLAKPHLMTFIREEYPFTKVIIMSSYDEIEVARKALMARANNFLIKPLDFDVLIQKLELLEI